MQDRNGTMLLLMSVLILASADTIFSNNNFVSSPLFTDNAYAQSSPSPSGPGNGGGGPGEGLGGPGAGPVGPGDSGAPGDNSTDLGGGLGGPGAVPGGPGDNSRDLGPGPEAGNITSMQGASNSQNSTSNTVPEFGPMASIILVLATVSIIIVSARTRLRFG